MPAYVDKDLIRRSPISASISIKTSMAVIRCCIYVLLLCLSAPAGAQDYLSPRLAVFTPVLAELVTSAKAMQDEIIGTSCESKTTIRFRQALWAARSFNDDSATNIAKAEKIAKDEKANVFVQPFANLIIRSERALLIQMNENMIESLMKTADASLSATCVDLADEFYRIIIQFPVPQYGSQVRRAQVGIDDVRVKRREIEDARREIEDARRRQSSFLCRTIGWC